MSHNAARNTVIDMLQVRASKYPDHSAYYYKENDKWHSKTWSEYYNQVVSFAGGLLKLGFKSGDVLCILGANKPQWVISCLACQMLGGKVAGIYNTCSPEEVSYVVDHAKAPFFVIENQQKYQNQLKPAMEQLPHLKNVILMERSEKVEGNLVKNFDDVVDLGIDNQSQVKKQQDEISEEGVGVLIYTSGTTGPPKAVMLSHKAVAWTVKTAVSTLNVDKNDKMLSYLPLAHIAEQMFTVYCPLASGANIYFAESMEKLADNLKEVQPSIFFGVPRVYEKVFAKLVEKLKQAPASKAKILAWSRDVATQMWRNKHSSSESSFSLLAKYTLANKVVFDKLKTLIGFANIRLAITGAAPISKEIIDFFTSLDIPLYEIYGQSEDCGPTSFNIPGSTKIGSVGRAFPGVEVKIAGDGEILVRGPNVFDGYYKDQAATDETLIDGWLYTGDIGRFDDDGFLFITDRKKDLIITAGGKNIAPQNIETMIKEVNLISQAVVVGDKKKYLSALLTLNPEATNNFALSKSKEEKQKEIIDEIDKAIKSINKKLAQVEQIKKFKVLPQEFSIEGGELTPTMKIKRKVVNEKFADEIQSLYQ